MEPIDTGSVETNIVAVGSAVSRDPAAETDWSEGFIHVDLPRPHEPEVSRTFRYDRNLVVTVDGQPVEDYLALMRERGHSEVRWTSVAIMADSAWIEYRVVMSDKHPGFEEEAVSVELRMPADLTAP